MAARIHNALPSLVVLYPVCGNCFGEVVFEDGVTSCPRCLIQWDGDDEDARPAPDPNVEGSNVACGKDSTRPKADGFRPLPCSLPAAHTSRHHHPSAYEPDETTR